MSPTDGELITRCRSDRDQLQVSFHALYERHSPPVYRFLRGLIGRQLANDCLQETFLRLFRQLDRYDAGRPLRPWLLGIARNVALDLARREAVRSTDPLPPELPGRAPSVPAQVAGRELSARLATAVAELPEREREVFLLKRVEGLTFKEVAAAIGCSLRTAKYRMRAAVDRLAASLRSEEEATHGL